MSITDITNITDFNSQQYETLIKQAQGYAIDSRTVNTTLLSEINSGKSFSEAVNNISTPQPQLTPPRSAGTAVNLQKWEVAPAPGALIMALLVTVAAQNRQTNRQVEWAQTEAVYNSMMDEAKTMRSSAATQLAMGIVGSALTVAGGIAQAKLSMTNPTLASGVGESLGGAAKAFDASGQYIGTMNQAAMKELEADQEKMRALRDSLKSLDDALHDLIAKALASMDSIQQNKNQAMTRILA